jgi:hypothetical protein
MVYFYDQIYVSTYRSICLGLAVGSHYSREQLNWNVTKSKLPSPGFNSTSFTIFCFSFRIQFFGFPAILNFTTTISPFPYVASVLMIFITFEHSRLTCWRGGQIVKFYLDKIIRLRGLNRLESNLFPFFLEIESTKRINKLRIQIRKSNPRKRIHVFTNPLYHDSSNLTKIAKNESLCWSYFENYLWQITSFQIFFLKT